MRPQNEKTIAAAAKKLHKDWLKITVKALKAEIKARGIKNSGALEASIEGAVMSYANGGAHMELEHLLYGMFVDMNVGRGRTRESNAENAMMERLYNQSMGIRGGRRAKKYMWYSRRMGKEQYKLGKLLMDLYASTCVDMAVNAMPRRIDLTM